MLQWPNRTSRERLDYSYDWAAFLNDGETITASAAESTGDFDITDNYMAADSAVQVIWVEGGSSGYAQIRMSVETSQDRKYEEIIRLDTTL